MIIVVTGSSGTGKTKIAKALAKRLKHKYLDVNELIKNKGLREKYLKRFDSYEVDIKKLNKVLVKLIKRSKNLVIDSHLSHYLPNKYVDYCVVCKCDLRVLEKRLKIRKYSEVKIRENLNSEIFDVCLLEALERGHKVIVIDTSNKNFADCVKEVVDKLLSKSSLSI